MVEPRSFSYICSYFPVILTNIALRKHAGILKKSMKTLLSTTSFYSKVSSNHSPFM